MFGLASWKLIGIAVILALIGSLLAAQHFTQKKLNAERRKTQTLEATITAEREARATEQADKRRADVTITQLNADLAELRKQPPITGVRCRTSRPVVSAEGRSAGTVDAAGSGAVEGVPVEPSGGDEAFGPEIDVSAAVDWYAGKCAEQAVTWFRLQEWDRNRTH